MIFRINYFTDHGNYSKNVEAKNTAEVLNMNVIDLPWFALSNKKGNVTLLNKDHVKSIVISEVKSDE